MRLEADGEYFILIVTDKYCPDELINSISNKDCEISLTVKNRIIFLFVKFDGTLLMEAPFNAKASPQFDINNYPVNNGYRVPIYLVNSRNGILKAIRMIQLNQLFSEKLKQEITEQLNTEEEYNHSKYISTLEEVYKNYSIKDLLKYKIARCKPTNSASMNMVMEIPL